MKRFTTILPLLALIVTSCHREPFAEADVSYNPGYVGEMLRFTSYSTNADYIEWDFDDGYTSNDPVVDHYFVDPGYYDVRLSAFGSKGGVSTAVIPLEVLGAELTVRVRLWTDIDAGDPPGYLVPNASVILYPTLQDWDNQTNPVLLPNGELYELITNSVGECKFTGLSYQRYYIDVWEAHHDNYTLGMEDPGFIETEMLDGSYDWTFEALVDYYPDGKKATAADERPRRELKAAPAGEKRVATERHTKVPRERK